MYTFWVYTILVLVLVVPAVYKGYKTYVSTKRLMRDTPNVKADTPLSLPQQWAVAAGANLSALNASYVNTLETGIPVDSIRTDILQRDWGVESRQDLLETLDFLMHDGHRGYYFIIRDILKLAENERPAALRAAQLEIGDRDLEQYYHNVLLGTAALHQQQVLPANAPLPTILAWDAGRLINLVRWGYDTHLLTEDEAWGYLLPTAQHLQQTYGSWADLSASYLLGRWMWGGDKSNADNVLYWHRTLLEHPSSPWRHLSWNLPLAT